MHWRINRSTSSTVRITLLGSRSSFVNASGWRSRVSMLLVIKLTVVSYPAPSSKIEMVRSSSSFICTVWLLLVVIIVAKPDIKSLAGLARRAAIRSLKYSLISAAACPACSISVLLTACSGSSIRTSNGTQTSKRGVSSAGTPAFRK